MCKIQIIVFLPFSGTVGSNNWGIFSVNSPPPPIQLPSIEQSSEIVIKLITANQSGVF